MHALPPDLVHSHSATPFPSLPCYRIPLTSAPCHSPTPPSLPLQASDQYYINTVLHTRGVSWATRRKMA